MDNQTLRHIPINMCLNDDNRCLTLTIVFHPDIYRIGEQSKQNNTGFELSRTSPLFSKINDKLDKIPPRPLDDIFISRDPIFITKKGDNWLLERRGSATSFSTLKEDNVKSLLLAKDMLNKGCVITLVGRVVLLIRYSYNISNDYQPTDFIGVSDNVAKIRSLISRVAILNAPILICGESGTGKELIAQAIHKCSKRSQRKLISINMAAIPNELVESELFGNVKGAFTGALTRNGCFQRADKSTLFLDEIGEAPAKVQITLLRALETGIVQSVGSNSEQRLDVRVIAATDANLELMVEQNSFRISLLQRLSGFVIDVLPLRDRSEDIGIILTKFLIDAFKTTDQLDKLLNLDDCKCCYWAWFYAQCCTLAWRGNVRQIKNTTIQLSILLMNHPHLSSFNWMAFVKRITHEKSDNQPSTTLVTERLAASKEGHEDPRVKAHLKRKPSEVSDDEIITALESNSWQIKLAAQQLKISRAALYLRIDANPNLNRAGDLSTSELHDSFAKFSGNVDMMVNDLKVSKLALTRRLKEIGLV